MPFQPELQIAGPVLAVVTFLTIWWGHVLVRITHYYYGTKPAPAVFVGGLLLLLGSTQAGSDLLSAVLGIVGLTLVWDAFELRRQELRVRQGHAPLNPRVHRVAAGMAAARLADGRAGEDNEGTCLSCGSTSNSRYLCRRGPYCKIRQWERYAPGEVADAPNG
ncbi:MAG: DUF4491 family protein [Chloroflexia bacterium]